MTGTRLERVECVEMRRKPGGLALFTLSEKKWLLHRDPLHRANVFTERRFH